MGEEGGDDLRGDRARISSGLRCIASYESQGGYPATAQSSQQGCIDQILYTSEHGSDPSLSFSVWQNIDLTVQ